MLSRRAGAPPTAAALACPLATAQDVSGAKADPVHEIGGTVERLSLTVGKGQIFTTSVPFAKLSTGDDKIVELLPQSDQTFLINAKGVGSTNIFALDSKNALIANLDVSVSDQLRPDSRVDGAGVRIYSRIYDSTGAINRPALYDCTERNCAAVSGPSADVGLLTPPSAPKKRPLLIGIIPGGGAAVIVPIYPKTKAH